MKMIIEFNYNEYYKTFGNNIKINKKNGIIILSYLNFKRIILVFLIIFKSIFNDKFIK